MPQLMPLNWCMSFLMIILLFIVFFLIYSDCLGKCIYEDKEGLKMLNVKSWKW